MSRIIPRVPSRCSSLVLGLTFLLGACASPAADPAAAEAQIRQAWEGLADAIEEEDWEAFARLWVQDSTVQVVSPDQGAWLRGWDQVSSAYRDVVSAGSALSFETTRLEITVGESGRTAWAVGEVVTTTGGASQTTWQMAVLRKVGDAWRFAAAWTGAVAPAPPLGS